MLKIKETRKDLYAYLEENPTIEQSRENVRKLAETFGDDLKREQNMIADRDTKAAEEMKELNAPQWNLNPRLGRHFDICCLLCIA